MRSFQFTPFRVLAVCLRAAFCATAILAAASSVQAAESRIVNGVTTHGYPTTGALLYSVSGNADAAGIICSGTLIGCRTFLTASHCVVDDADPTHYFVFLQHAGVFAASSVVPHDDYRDATFPIADVAVVTLGAPVTGIAPTAVNDTDPEPFIPHPGVIVGYGQTLGGAGDFGIKRAGAVETENCNSAQIPQGAGNTELVCWSYSAPVGPPGDDSNTCNGDSGGPLFLDLGSGTSVAGVTSGGTSGSCDVGDHSYDANVFTYRSFILNRLGSDSTAACGPIPAVDDPDVSVIGNDGTLSGTNTEDSYTVSLSAHTNVLRFVLNGEDNGSLDADLYVRRGAPPTTSVFDCKADGASNFGACEFILPVLDTWHVLVRRKAGSGDYQLTTTIFGGAAPVCGNNVAETGEECDGTDDGLCAGLCNNATCTCPPPSCGNGVAEQGEQCDGADAGACLSGTCEGDCTCTPACGDGICNNGETASSCAADCGCAAAGACPFGQAPDGCFCDELCEQFGDCCPDACLECNVCQAGCGNGIVEPGEECDDGNTLDGDCCSSTCTADPAGTPCDDGTLCTTADQCDGAGACTGDAALATGCFTSGKAVLKVLDRAGGAKDQFKWLWARGEEVGLASFGDPATADAYELCVFDLRSGQPVLGVSATVEPSALWRPKSAGWVYVDRQASAEGVRKIQLKAGADGKSKVKVIARGAQLGLPGPFSAQYFASDPSVVAELRAANGACWSADFPDSVASTQEKFLAKSP